jgi:methylisocitrate lyase
MDFSGNHLLSREAAVQRIRAAVEARRDPDLVIIARTDGGLVSRAEAITRMQLLADAGADVVYPTHFPFSQGGRRRR